MSVCLRGDGDSEFVEGALLEDGRAGRDDDGWGIAEAHEVAGEGGQIMQQAAEAVQRAAIGGVLARGLGVCRGRDFGATGEGLAAAAAGRS